MTDTVAEIASRKPPKLPRAVETAAAAPRPVIHLLPGKWHMSDEVFNRIIVHAEKDMVPDDLNGSEAWALLVGVKQLIQLYTDVRVVHDDWLADVVIIDHSPSFAIGKVVQVIALPKHREDQDGRIPVGYTIRPARPSEQPNVGWLVIRDSSGVVISGGHILETRESAIRFCLDHPSVTQR